MKAQVKVVAAHARRHRELLDQQWEQTDWSRPQAEVVLRRMDGVRKLLPQAQQQAHERIIGERIVNNSDKLLSLYETDTRVIARGKAGAEVEFGNTLLLADQHIYDGICPQNPARLKEPMGEERFGELQRRRSQTEGRIGIFKNGFVGRPLRAKGFDHREEAMGWQVLTHNLWVLARLEQKAALAPAA